MTSSIYPWFAAPWQDFVGRLQNGRLGHALIIDGMAGLGQGAFADLIAQRLLCQNAAQLDQNHIACGQCSSCHWLQNQQHPDRLDLRAEVGKKTIGIDLVRQFLADLVLTGVTPTRVGCIQGAERLNRNASDSLLKTLEEPPLGRYLLLICEQPLRLSATIRSRCQRLTLTVPDGQITQNYFEKNNLNNINKNNILLKLAGGAPLLAQQWHEAGVAKYIPDWLESWVNLRDINQNLNLYALAKSWAQMLNTPELLNVFLRTWCAVVMALLHDSGDLGEAAVFQKMRRQTPAPRFGFFLGKLAEDMRSLEGNANLQLWLEDKLILFKKL